MSTCGNPLVKALAHVTGRSDARVGRTSKPHDDFSPNDLWYGVGPRWSALVRVPPHSYIVPPYERTPDWGHDGLVRGPTRTSLTLSV